MKTIDEMIYCILQWFRDGKDEKNKKHRKLEANPYWNLDTCLYGILNKLHEKIKDIQDKNLKYFIIKITNNLNKKNNYLYELTCNDINITPAKDKIYVAKSTMDQYIRFLNAIGLIKITNKYNINNLINNKIDVVSGIKFSIINNEHINMLIYKLIHNSFYSLNTNNINLAFSIFITSLIYYEYDFKNLKTPNEFYIKKWVNKKCNGEIKNKYICINKLNSINDIINGNDYTYKKLFLNVIGKYNTLEDFISNIYNYKNENILNDDEIKRKEIDAKILTERSKFNNNIKENRKNLGLYLDGLDYSDIVDENNIPLGIKWNDNDAAHIYEVKNIKKAAYEENDYKKQIDIISYVSNPYNGLMMNKIYHQQFDKGLFSFSIDGKMIYDEANKEYIFEQLKLQKISIRNELIEHDEIKEFLLRRIG